MSDDAFGNPTLLGQFCEFLARTMGLYFPVKSRAQLLKKIGPTAKGLGFRSTESYIKHLLQVPTEKQHIQALADALTVGETYFFREETNFNYLKQTLLPKLIEERAASGHKTLKLWSAACSTGEEPFTLAIMLSQLIPDLSSWDITILGTDINETFLDKARKASYRDWAFRSTPDEAKRAFFRPDGNGEFVLKENIRAMVDFSCLNLVDIQVHSPFTRTREVDIILCHNVLIYFSTKEVQKVVRSFMEALNPQGYLFVTAVEAPFVHSDRVRKLERAFGYQKVIAHRVAKPPSPPQPTVAKAEVDTKQASPLIDQLAIDKMSGLYQQGHYEAVVQEVKDSLLPSGNIPPSFMEATHLVVYSLDNLGKTTEALRWCEKAIAQEQLNSRLHYLRATILLEMQRDKEAATSLRRAIFLDPGFVIAHFALGNLMLKNQDPVEAARHLRNTAEILQQCNHDEILPGTEAMTAERLKSLMQALKVKV